MGKHIFFLLIASIALPVSAQSKPGELIRVTLHAAAPVTPSLKYRLLPDYSELLPGNAAAGDLSAGRRSQLKQREGARIKFSGSRGGR
jgi:hypothetical protein